MKKTIPVRLEEYSYNKLKDRADETKQSMNAVVNQLIITKL